LIFDCWWNCPKCANKIQKDTELYEIYNGLVKCPDCKIKMELISVVRKNEMS